MSEAVKRLQIILNQQGAKLIVDGDLGNLTKQAIDNLKIPLHLKIALKEVGTREIVGEKDNPRVKEYHTSVGGIGWKDEIAWCGSVMGWIMLKAKYITKRIEYSPPTYAYRALSWVKFGKSVNPCIGAVCVKSRKGGGHVTLLVGQLRDGRLLCAGGNQNNEFNIGIYRVSDFLDFRLPSHLIPQPLLTFDLNVKSTAINEA
ncbi:MAG: TIGR02594 family protein [Candidatus Cloacimonadaceae bacterium]